MISKYKLRDFGCTQRFKDIMGKKTIVWGPRNGWVDAAILYTTLQVPISPSIVEIRSKVLKLHEAVRRDYLWEAIIEYKNVLKK